MSSSMVTDFCNKTENITLSYFTYFNFPFFTLRALIPTLNIFAHLLSSTIHVKYFQNHTCIRNKSSKKSSRLDCGSFFSTGPKINVSVWCLKGPEFDFFVPVSVFVIHLKWSWACFCLYLVLSFISVLTD